MILSERRIDTDRKHHGSHGDKKASEHQQKLRENRHLIKTRLYLKVFAILTVADLRLT